MRAAVLAHNACDGDAIGNRLAAKVRLLLRQGWQVRVFVESASRLHPALTERTTETTADALRKSEEDYRWLCECDLILVEFGVTSNLLRLLPSLPRPGPRILAEYHGVTPPHLWPNHLRWRWNDSLRDCDLLRWADRVTVLSRFATQELNDTTGLPRSRMRVVPGFVEPELCTVNPADLRRRFGLEGVSILLFVGRLAPNKRPPLLVEAVHRLRDHKPEIHAVFVGPKDDIYAEEADKCRVLAESLGVVNRIHMRGWVSRHELDAWYRAANVLVVPSLHEGFCLPVIEAMARGLPVVVARAAALPETVGSAGLTFEPDDVADLVRQLRRVLNAHAAAKRVAPRRLAVVMPRFGPDFAGGAERSLTRIAKVLATRGCQIEIFATDAEDEAGQRAKGRTGTRHEAGLLVHRYPVEAGSPEKLQRLLHPRESRSADLAALLRLLPRSARLVDALDQRRTDFDAIIVGPYSHGLTWQIAARMPDQTILVPCFHDEALARHPVLLHLCRGVAGLLYHSPEEQQFAEGRLGINHPISDVIGTWLEPPRGDARRGREHIGGQYILYCGRCIAEKGFRRLLDWMARLREVNRAAPRLVVIGCPQEALPKAPWLIDLGFVDEARKCDLLAGAEALVLLSANESLSLAVLEAWNEGTPVIVSAESEVLVGQITRSNGGVAVANFEQFASALLSLGARPDEWRIRGAAGQQFVARNYRNGEAFAQRIEAVLENRHRPFRDVLVEAGRRRAAQFSLDRWEERFASVVEESMNSPADAEPETAATDNDLCQQLVELHRLRTLPDDYVDVTHGPLAWWKRRIKQKLLHNFRTAYVDVLAQQQSRFNTVLVEILSELIDKRTARAEPDPGSAEKATKLVAEMQRLRRRLARLEKQVQQLARSWS